MKTIIKVVECTNHKDVYGFLIVKNAKKEEVQQKIYDIKNSDENIFVNSEWTIEDVFKRFPQKWDYKFIQNDCCVEI